MNFSGQNIVITGAGSGFGLASAQLFASRGGRIIAVDRNADRVAAMLQDLNTDWQQEHFSIVADLRPADAAEKIVAEAMERAGSLHILVNSAGVCHFNRINTISHEEWDEIMDVDVRALFYMAVHCAEAMKKGGNPGAIINLASNAARKGRALSAHYAAAKAAVVSITESLALAYGPDGITVNTVSPAVILTPMWDQNFEELCRITGRTPEQLKEAWINQTPMRRLGTPEEVAGLITFLACDRGTFITGQHINICGGFMHTC